MTATSIETAMGHLRLDDPDETELVKIYLAAAENMASDYIQRQFYADKAALDTAISAGGDTETAIVVTPAITVAVLLALGHLYANRESTTTLSVEELPLGFRAILAPYRTGLGV